MVKHSNWKRCIAMYKRATEEYFLVGVHKKLRISSATCISQVDFHVPKSTSPAAGPALSPHAT
jgi:hypothetical protein